MAIEIGAGITFGGGIGIGSGDPAPTNLIEYLVVGGGGAGGGGAGTASGSGGGAGGLLYGVAELALAATYTVTVGSGSAATGGTASNGSPSSLSGSGLSITALGGGGGLSGSGTTGQNGGSGGGAAAGGAAGTFTGGSGYGYPGTPGSTQQGYPGGNGITDNVTYRSTGGGGGAGGAGENATSSISGNGGDGYTWSVTGNTYAGGGGGASWPGRRPGTGGSGIGGNGGNGDFSPGTAGTPGTGSGGGGGGYERNSGAGGDGVVILAIPTAEYTGQVTGSPTVTTSGSNTIITFTANGSYSTAGAPVTTGSVQFNGSSQYLTISNNSNLNLGSGDFTLEGWYNPTVTSGRRINLMSKWNDSGNQRGWKLDWNNGSYEFWYSTNGSDYPFLSMTGTFPENKWTHIAFVRNGNTVYLYINGIQTYTTSFTSTIYATTSQFAIGTWFDNSGSVAGRDGVSYYSGYMSNLRMVTGTAVYTSAFTPSTIPLTAISGTQLLTAQSASTITDASTNAFTITNVGSAVPATSNPFIGGSTLFNGSGSYLSASAPALPTGNSSYTIECWIYNPVADRGEIINWGTQNNNQLNAFRVNTSGNGLDVYWWFSDLGTGNIGLTQNTWYHVVSQWDGTTRKIFVNGVLRASDTPTPPNVTGTNVLIGQINSDYFTGYISNLRVCNVAVYPGSTYTVPDVPLTAISGTQLLICQSTTSVTADASTNAYTLTNNSGCVAAGASPFNTLPN